MKEAKTIFRAEFEQSYVNSFSNKISNKVQRIIPGAADYLCGMNIRFCLILIGLLFGGNIHSHAQVFKPVIQVLAHDSLEGRGTGSNGEKKAAAFIIQQMKIAGLKAYDQYPDYKHSFEYLAARIPSNCTLKSISDIRSEKYILYKDYYPLSLCGTSKAFSGLYQAGFGIVASELNQNDYATFNSADSGKIFLINVANPDGVHPHSHFNKFDLSYRVQEAKKRGASAVIFYKTDPKVEDPDTSLSVKIKGLDIPVLYAKHPDFTNGRLPKNTAVFIETEIQSITKTGTNILGTLDYGKLYTIVIGAHYDHLGRGDQGGSLHAAHSKEVHNGADDNASGVAMMLDLIKRVASNNQMHQYNYMFVAFSGEELGLYGSSNLVRALPINPLRVNCMLNMDMVGRLDPTQKTLAVSGTGTSPFWSVLDSIKTHSLEIKKSESGVGPSDHTSFYKENIPVLHFFTGMHSDYHKPSDDESLINYQGMELVAQYIYQVLQKVNGADRLAFTKTKDTEQNDAPRYKVSLGIMPDYVFQGTGVRADGVTDGKPAQKAGIQKGDIILAIGEFTTSDMMAYTKALGQFSKGDTTKVKIIRNGAEMLISVTF